VPSDWNHGRVALWLRSWVQTTFLDHGRVYLDGKIIPNVASDGTIKELSLEFHEKDTYP
jgi:hypothetical protein